MKPLPEAQREVLAAMRPLPADPVQLADAAGLVLAEGVTAPHDVPPFTNSAMDGFAVRSTDTADAPARLRILEDVPAGTVASRAVEPGGAIRIMTGAPLPEGADAVVKVEDTEVDGEIVTVLRAVGAGTSVRPAGGDVASGQEVFPAGERLGPQHLGVLASLGVVRPLVCRRPRAAVLSTGDEVLPPDTAVLSPGSIRDANRPMIAAMLSEAGAEVVDLGIVGDDEARLRAVLADAAEAADIIVTSGGVSVGDYDLMRNVLGDLGGIDVWRVAMKPGKPFAFGLLAGTPLFGLPGNPVSVSVTFEQFVRPSLLHRMGARRVFRPRGRGRTMEDIDSDPRRTEFARVSLRSDGGETEVRPSGGQESNMLAALARADALAVIPAGISHVPAGSEVELELFRRPEARTIEEVLDG
jgi:molybdopterin molybdotransferase